jgi:hypothetical protein
VPGVVDEGGEATELPFGHALGRSPLRPVEVGGQTGAHEASDQPARAKAWRAT